MNKTRKNIDDKKVFIIYSCPECGKTTECNPNDLPWYTDEGTPKCYECGDFMEYKCTEIEE